MAAWRWHCCSILKPASGCAPVALVAVVAMGDAIGALAPPVVAVTNAWPDRIEVNGALVGGAALHALPGAQLLLEAEVLVSSAAEYEAWRETAVHVAA